MQHLNHHSLVSTCFTTPLLVTAAKRGEVTTHQFPLFVTHYSLVIVTHLSLMIITHSSLMIITHYSLVIVPHSSLMIFPHSSLMVDTPLAKSAGPRWYLGPTTEETLIRPNCPSPTGCPGRPPLQDGHFLPAFFTQGDGKILRSAISWTLPAHIRHSRVNLDIQSNSYKMDMYLNVI